jgi:hypothetical protein
MRKLLTTALWTLGIFLALTVAVLAALVVS